LYSPKSTSYSSEEEKIIYNGVNIFKLFGKAHKLYKDGDYEAFGEKMRAILDLIVRGEEEEVEEDEEIVEKEKVVSRYESDYEKHKYESDKAFKAKKSADKKNKKRSSNKKRKTRRGVPKLKKSSSSRRSSSSRNTSGAKFRMNMLI